MKTVLALLVLSVLGAMVVCDEVAGEGTPPPDDGSPDERPPGGRPPGDRPPGERPPGERPPGERPAREGRPGQGPPRRRRAKGSPRKMGAGGRGADIDETGKIGIRGKSKKFSLELIGYTEINSTGHEITQHTMENTTSLMSSEPANETIPFSKDGSGGEVPARCVVSDITFESGTVVAVKTCMARENGTLELGTGDSAEEHDIRPGFGKVSVKLSSHTWCDTSGAAGTEACDAAIGHKIRLDFQVADGDKRRAQGKPRGGRRPGGKLPPKVYEIGNSQFLLSLVVAEMDGETVKKWVQLDDNDVTVTAGDEGQNMASFSLPRPDDPSTQLWYDPTVDLEDEPYEEGDDDSGAAGVSAAILTPLTAALCWALVH